MEKVYVQTVRLAIAVPEDKLPNVDAYLADATNEALRELQRGFSPESAILDYAIDAWEVNPARVEGYEEGDAFCFPQRLRRFALCSPQGTACAETVLTAAEYADPGRRAAVEAQFCRGGADDPVAGQWADVTHNEACA